MKADKGKALLFLILSAFLVFKLDAQDRIVVRNSENAEPIPFAHLQLKDEKKVFASDKNGVFYLQDLQSGDEILVSALGFQKKAIKFSKRLKVIQLEPQVFGLKEVEVLPQEEKTFLAGKHRRKSNRSFGLGDTGGNIKFARYFDFKQEFEHTPYIKSVHVMSRSDIKNAEFEINFYQLDSMNCPDEPVFEDWIKVRTRRGKKRNKIELDRLFPIPNEGLYVVVRILHKEQNRYEYKYTKSGSRKKYIGVSYEPSICLIPLKEGEYFIQHKDSKSWLQASQWGLSGYVTDVSKYYEGKAVVPAIELLLTN